MVAVLVVTNAPPSRVQHNAEQATQRITNTIQGNAGKLDAKDRTTSAVGKDAKR